MTILTFSEFKKYLFIYQDNINLHNKCIQYFMDIHGYSFSDAKDMYFELYKNMNLANVKYIFFIQKEEDEINIRTIISDKLPDEEIQKIYYQKYLDAAAWGK